MESKLVWRSHRIGVAGKRSLETRYCNMERVSSVMKMELRYKLVLLFSIHQGPSQLGNDMRECNVIVYNSGYVL